MNLKETEYECLDWIQLTRYKTQGRAHGQTVNNRVP